ncbi:hypothetical protein KPH14_005878 [Odynerus spinipes]|uniref:Uncharacterized protein n=1 Tax=Odynerus spinipes TaxID=1348599 RepID=A0AAD9RC70_9HYME|nr:hypothetical protein KPH14_005878 [Odynerus spinipes]
MAAGRNSAFRTGVVHAYVMGEKEEKKEKGEKSSTFSFGAVIRSTEGKLKIASTERANASTMDPRGEDGGTRGGLAGR